MSIVLHKTNSKSISSGVAYDTGCWQAAGSLTMNKIAFMLAVLVTSGMSCESCGGPKAIQLPPSPLPPCTTPEPIRINLFASSRLNPGENGESLPINLRIYQLKDTGRLAQTTLDRILDNDRAELAEDFVSMQELTLYPGERAAPALVRSVGATSLAVVAMFRQPIGPSWRAIRKLPDANQLHCHVRQMTPAMVAATTMNFIFEDSRIDMR
jgi:type VI secretion system protein VasD